MGFMSALSACYGCRQVFSYNPERVPSIRVNGVREPICESCVEAANPERAKNGLPPIVVLPDAYTGAEVA